MIRIEVVHSPGPRQALAATLSLPSPAVAGQALAAWLATPQGRASGLDAPSLASHLGVWGRRVGPDEPLRDGDRLELYRPLQCDPKESRRRRQRLAGQARAGSVAGVAPAPAPAAAAAPASCAARAEAGAG